MAGEYTLLIRPETGKFFGVRRVADGAFIPNDSGNNDYQAFLLWNAIQSVPLVLADITPVPPPVPPLLWNRIKQDRTTASLTAVDVTDMAFPVGAGEVWAFEFYCNVGSSQIAGFKIGFAAFASAAIRALVKGNPTTQNTFAIEQITAFSTLGQAWCAAVTNNGWLEIRGVVRAGATAGVVQLRAAKITSGNATLFTDSYFIARQLPG